jgi:hypothetical protein
MPKLPDFEDREGFAKIMKNALFLIRCSGIESLKDDSLKGRKSVGGATERAVV